MTFNTLKLKLLGAFAVVAMISAIVGLFGLSVVQKIDGQLKYTVTNLTPSLDAVARARYYYFRALWMTARGLAAVEAQDKAEFKHSRAERDASLNEIKSSFIKFEGIEMLPEEAPPFREMQGKYQAWETVNNSVWEALEGNDPKKAWEISKTRSLETIDAATLAMHNMIETERMLLARSTVLAAETEQHARSVMLTTIALGALTAFGLGLILTLAITRPLERLKDAAIRMAKGDVNQTIEHRSTDEVGQLAESFRGLVEYIQGVARAAASLAAGDLSVDVTSKSDADLLSKNMGRAISVLRGLVQEVKTLIAAARDGELAVRGDTSKYQGGYAELLGGMNGVLEAVSEPLEDANRTLAGLAARDLTVRARTDFEGDYGRMMASLNLAAENLQESLLQVSTSSEQVASAAHQIASSSQAVAQGATEQASALEETSSALIEMAAATKRNADSAKEANGLSENARESSVNGGAAMGQMTEAMNKIRAAAAGTAAIIRDINEIAFQTNLLSLNAAVEAGRAGEAGRGFAVVAEEVRNLALRSKEAAKKTEALIGESMALAQHGEDISQRVNNTLTQTVNAVGSVSKIVAEISRASQEQAEGIEQSNRAMSQMDQVTQQAAANSEETSSAAEELAAQAQELATLVGQFQLGSGNKQGGVKAAGKPARRPPALPHAHAEQRPRAAQAAKNGNARSSNGFSRSLAEALIPMHDDAALRNF